MGGRTLAVLGLVLGIALLADGAADGFVWLRTDVARSVPLGGGSSTETLRDAGRAARTAARVGYASVAAGGFVVLVRGAVWAYGR